MATFKAADIATPQFMGGYGNAAIALGSVVPTAGALNDVYIPVVIPGGMRVTDVDIINDDLDTGTGVISAKIGYSPVNSDGPTANDAYFAATSTFMNAVGRKTCVFQPIKFEKPVFLIITLTVAANVFSSGNVTAVVKGIAEGIK